MRIDKFLAHSGFGSRKDVKVLLKKKRVEVNDVIITKDKVQIDEDNDIVKVDGNIINYKKYEYYMLNKPKGYICANDDGLYPSVNHLIKSVNELFTVGRLDVDTEGLLLLTNDGKFAHHLTSPTHHVKKTYEVIVDKVINEDDIITFKNGIPLKDFTCKSALLEVIKYEDNKSYCHVTIEEGKYHQVKRMFRYVGGNVIYLKRIQMGFLKLDNNLKLGQYRALEIDEINRLNQ